MAHGDDDGVRIPPMVAPTQIIILPIIPKEENRQAVINAAESLAESLGSSNYGGLPIRVEVDKRDMQGGEKNWEWIKKEHLFVSSSAPATLKKEMWQLLVAIDHQRRKNLFPTKNLSRE